MPSQITSLTIVYPTVYSGADQRKHQSSASLAFVRGIHRGPVNSPHKGLVTRKMFPFDDIIMRVYLPALRRRTNATALNVDAMLCVWLMTPLTKTDVDPFVALRTFCGLGLVSLDTYCMIYFAATLCTIWIMYNQIWMSTSTTVVYNYQYNLPMSNFIY